MFGVKNSLVVTLEKVQDEEMAQKYGVNIGTRLLAYDFVLVSEEEASKLRREKAEEAMASQGRSMKFVNNLPVPDVD